ncbi:MAG: hypothetical protein M1818_004872 [Claussenomyces sp. TS43310]|nr:MAG: hypothetical protein M1818_004872 [Claussenomyces sp. TS43310]
MDSTQIIELLEHLDDDIDDLEDSLLPALKPSLTDTASRLPLLDKVKLYVLITYAIESILFSYLRLNGVKAREHPVFKELVRVRQYFDKIKLAEIPTARQDRLSIDKKAAGRIIKAGLSGNERYGLERAELLAKERALAHIRSKQTSKRRKSQVGVAEQPADTNSSETSASDSEVSRSPAEKLSEGNTVQITKKQKLDTVASEPGRNIRVSKKDRGKPQKQRKAYQK